MLEYNYSGKTYSNWFTTFKAIFKHAMLYFDLQSNPCERAGGFKIAHSKKVALRFWTYEEFEIFYNNIHNLRDQAIFLLFYYSGLRPGELCCLQWKDLSDNHIHVNKTITRVNNKQVVGQYTKNKKNRDVSLPNFVIEKLLEYKEQARSELPRFSENFFMFGNKTKWLPTTTLRNKIDQYRKAKDKKKTELVKHIRAHDFRHSHASYLVHLGIDIEQIAERLGHESSEITRKYYLHLYPKDQDAIATKMQNIFEKKWSND